MASDIYVGVDIGSATVKVVGIDDEGQLVGERIYLRHDSYKHQVDALKDALRKYLDSITDSVAGIGTTGSGRELNRRLLGAAMSRTEIFAHAVGIRHLVDAGLAGVNRLGSVIEIGGQDSKVIVFDDDGTPTHFNMNSICSAGTGEFLKQLADEAGIGIEEFGPIAIQSTLAARIDATCTVFSRRDFRHLTQKGVPLADRLMGVAHALVTNYHTNVLGGHRLRSPVLFQGGVASNEAVRRAFEAKIGEPVLVAPYHTVVGALGMALIVRDHLRGESEASREITPFIEDDFFQREFSSRLRYCHGCENSCELTQPIEIQAGSEPRVLDTLGGRCDGFLRARNVHERPREAARTQKLFVVDSNRRVAPRVKLATHGLSPRSSRGSLFAGVDGGSRGTKWALIRDTGEDVEVVRVGVLDTGGDAIRAVLDALRSIRLAIEDAGGEELGAIGTTGSAGELAQHILTDGGMETADYRSTELIAHYAWARRLVPDVGTVMDIGGNDAKIMTVSEMGLDFAMNDKCAAGTGAFLETVARRLHVPVEEYGRAARSASAPARISGRCAVFGESDVVHKARMGFGTADLLAGVAHSVVRTYLSDVAKGKSLRLPIVAQGGVFLNEAVVTVFRERLGVGPDDFVVAPDPDLVIGAGALGAALLARDMFRLGYPSTFKGFEHVLHSHYDSVTTDCSYTACARSCKGLVLLKENGKVISGYKSIDCPFGFFDGRLSEQALAGMK